VRRSSSSRAISLSEGLVLKVRERRPSPESERVVEQPGRLPGLAIFQKLPSLVEQQLEAMRVEALDRRSQDVSGL
jgi:hypothetical protein